MVDKELHSCHNGSVCLPPCDLQEQSSLLPGLNCDALTVVVVGLENINIVVVPDTTVSCSLKPRLLEEGESRFATIYIDGQTQMQTMLA